MHTSNLVSQVREEHQIGITKHTDALTGLADDVEHIKLLLSRTLSHAQPPCSWVQDARVLHQGSSPSPQSAVRS